MLSDKLVRIAIALPAILWTSVGWSLDPVRPGDKIEVKYSDTWYPGEVLRFEKNQAQVKYLWGSVESNGIFTLDKMRFPNGEGTWRVWQDATGKFKIEARLIRRTDKEVVLRKEDGSEVTVPIEKLSETLQRLVEKANVAEKKALDSALVRVGDKIEVNYFSTWYPGIVKQIVPGGAVVEYDDGWGKSKSHEFKYEVMRYSDGEGPWNDWSDASGKYNVKARYLSHDETHVELLLEGGKRIRMERSQLSARLQKELSKRTILSKRPQEVAFDLSSVDFTSLHRRFPSGSHPAPFSPKLVLGSNLDAVPNPRDGVIGIPITGSHVIDRIIPLAGDDGFIAIAMHSSDKKNPSPTTLTWLNTSTKKILPGPNFLYGEMILGYSAEQKRLLTGEGFDLRGSPSRFCTYRLSPGDTKAVPEWKWSVPEISFASIDRSTDIEFVGTDRILIGYGGTVSMWDMKEKKALFGLQADNGDFSLNRNANVLCVSRWPSTFLIDVDSGSTHSVLAGCAESRFSRDGTYLVGSNQSQYQAWNLTGQRDAPLVMTKRLGTGLNGAPSLIGQDWLFDGEHVWSVQRELLAWTVEPSKSMTPASIAAFQDKIVSAGYYQKSAVERFAVFQIATLPLAEIQSQLNAISDEEFYVLRPGARVRIDPSARNNEMLGGIQRAMAKQNWIEDDASPIVLKGFAGPGKSETRTYNFSRFGMGTATEESKVTYTLTPWIQRVEVVYGGETVWSTQTGVIASSVSVKAGESPEARLRECEKPSYELFKSLELPERITAPKYRNGCGTTTITPTGLQNVAVTK